jgi:hypothetical protein
MPQRRSSYLFAALAAVGVLATWTAAAEAQEQPPPQPAPQPAPTVVIQYQAPPPQAPPQYAPPPQQYQAPVYPQTPQIFPQNERFSGPRIIRDWDDSRPIPPGYHPEERARLGLVIGGAVTFGTLYLFTALGASISNDAGTPASALYIPGVGPFIQLAQCNSPCSATGNFFLAVDGVAQLGGIAMFIAGLAAPKTVLVRTDAKLDLHFVPVMARDQNGMALVGRF